MMLLISNCKRIFGGYILIYILLVILIYISLFSKLVNLKNYKNTMKYIFMIWLWNIIFY